MSSRVAASCAGKHSPGVWDGAKRAQFNHSAAAGDGIIKADGQSGQGSQINTSAHTGAMNITPLFLMKRWEKEGAE